MRVLVYDADRCWNIRRKECECSVSRSWLLHAGSLASMKAKLCYFNCTTNTSLCHGESDIPNFRLITISDVKCRTKLITDLSTQSDVPREVKQPLREVFTDWRKPVRSVVRRLIRCYFYTQYIFEYSVAPSTSWFRLNCCSTLYGRSLYICTHGLST